MHQQINISSVTFSSKCLGKKSQRHALKTMFKTAGVNNKKTLLKNGCQNLSVTCLQFLKFYSTSFVFLLPVLIQFSKLQVLDGVYDGVTLKCASQAIIADNETGKNGYTVPLEVLPAGQFEPLYRTPLSIQVSHSWTAWTWKFQHISICFLGEGLLC